MTATALRGVDGSPAVPVAGAGRVLLVDDDLFVLQSYRRVLERHGFRVKCVSDSRSLAEGLEADELDVVVSDIAMPGFDGLAVLRAVRKFDPDMPVVLMTGGPALETALEAIEHGVLRYLLKPVEPSDLLRCIEEAVRMRRMALIKRLAFDLYGRATQAAEDRTELERRFDQALERLKMVYQPIVSWSRANIAGYEALVRTRVAGLERPDQLFSAAEQLGRVKDLGRAIRRAVADGERPPGEARLFVNLHPDDLGDDDLFDPQAPLSAFAERIVLEITERGALDRLADLRTRVDGLRALGYQVAVDDLGAGYAGLQTFAQIRPDVVKLDMSLVRNIDQDVTKRKLVEAMIVVCRDLGIEVVCEGVGSRAERDTLVRLGGDLLQGYFFAKPGRGFGTVRKTCFPD